MESDTKPPEAELETKIIAELGQLRDALKPRKDKDVWDKFSAATTFLSTVLLAAIGTWFTVSYNWWQAAQQNDIQNHQLHIREVEIVASFIPYLEKEEGNSRKAALIVIAAFDEKELALSLSQLYGGRSTIEAVTDIAVASDNAQVVSDARKVYDRIAAQAGVVIPYRVAIKLPDGKTAYELRTAALSEKELRQKVMNILKAGPKRFDDVVDDMVNELNIDKNDKQVIDDLRQALRWQTEVIVSGDDTGKVKARQST
jgi:hypothetical protein